MGEDTREARRRVEAARDQLGGTVETLAHRANAPRRARDRLTNALARLKRRVNPKRRST